MEIAEFNRRLILQFLNEMAVPVKATFESGKRSIRAEPALSGTKRLKYLADAQVAPGNVGREA